jgi:hypothetical protein
MYVNVNANVHVNVHVDANVRENANVHVFSLGLSNATEEQQVHSAIWDMPMWGQGNDGHNTHAVAARTVTPPVLPVAADPEDRDMDPVAPDTVDAPVASSTAPVVWGEAPLTTCKRIRP